MASKYGPLKRGIVREDGRIFSGYKSGKEQWLTEKGYAALRVRQQKHDRKPSTVARKKDYWKVMRGTSLEVLMFRNARNRAKKSGIPFSIVESDIIIPVRCPVLGIPLFVGNRKNSDNAPSLDRLRPGLGYVKGNIFVISKRANQIKNCGTLEEHRAIADWMERSGYGASA